VSLREADVVIEESPATGGMASSPSEHEIQQSIRLVCGRWVWQCNNAGALLERQGQLQHL
jgi:hypothetical protein